jgi:hypothetical protein
MSRAIRAVAAIAAAAVASAFASAAHAGRSWGQRPPTALAVSQGMGLAERTAARLTQTGADVVVIARAGQNLSAYGLRYSHLGFAYREGEGRNAVWRVVHKLNECGTAHASLYRQGLGEFLLDDPWQYEAAVVVPTARVQTHLRALLADNVAVARLDTPAYSVVAYPWSSRYQQSNPSALETIALAEEPAAVTRERAQAWLRLHGYEPTTLRLTAFTRLGARLTRANVAFDDHPNEKRFSDRIETVTVDSVFRWLERDGLAGPAQVIR